MINLGWDYDGIKQRLHLVETLDTSSLETSSLVERLLDDEAHDYATEVYSSLYVACWQLLATDRPGEALIFSWRSVFLKATVLMRAKGKATLASQCFVLSNMMNASMKRAETSP